MWSVSQYKNKQIAIIGLSTEGLDTVSFFAKSGALITCCDKRTAGELGDSYEKLKHVVADFHLGSDYLSGLDSFDIVVRTPGMALRTPELVQAKKSGVQITSQTKLFFDHCAAPIIGVTGTKGKGTTSTLIYEMLKASGKKAWLGGNVGTPLLSQIHEIASTDIVVLELSSFQLEDLHRSPHIAVVLKITQEHLANYDPLASNFHLTREDYVAAKKSIIAHQDVEDICVYNMDDATSQSFGEQTKAHAYAFSRKDESADAYVKNHGVFVRIDGKDVRICSADEIKLIGEHNLENIAAASLVSLHAGATLATIQKTVREFQGLEHRLELAGSVRGVDYYNDSFSTVPETTIAAIHSFQKPIILIVGGSDKGSVYEELGKEIAASSVKAICIIGVMTQKILDAVKHAGFGREVVTGLSDMHEIVAWCDKQAQSGDVVLLSPACASFDMFKNYKERGAQFKEEVRRIGSS